jgi:glutathione synthase/RimK-type ligase-like ATP-grasp enzyme
MHQPKIVIFWGKPTGPVDTLDPHPYARIGKKKAVYDQLFLELSKQADVYAAVGYENYPKPLFFTEAYRFLGPDSFEKVIGGILADAVYDRSAKMTFPGQSELENIKVVNSSDFKRFSNNKWELYQEFPEFCPKTRFAETKNYYLEALKKLNPENMYVVKPYNGFKGKGIMFGNPDQLMDYPFEIPVIIQDFKETSDGIPGHVKGRHDLRVAVVNGEIVWATIRQPAGKNLLANVYQGGSIKEIEIASIPKSVLPIVEKMSEEFRSKFNNPLFAIDFGFEEGRPFIYEINDQIGFPLPEMKENTLIKSLAKLLLKRSEL